MKAIFWVSDEELIYIKNGMPVQITKNDKVYNGRISEVALAQDEMRKAFKIEADFPNPKRELKVGMTVEIQFDSYKNPSAIVIPRSSDGSNAQEREITLGKTIGEMVEITSGLNVGDELITEGVSILTSGAKLNIKQ